MKVGDYVRIVDVNNVHYFGKLVNINEFREPDFRYCLDIQREDLIFISGDMIEDSSPDIRDLIEVGDIITFKGDDEVFRVICVPDKDIENDKFLFAKQFDGETEDIWCSKEELEKDFSIVTKQLFERVSFKVGD